MGEFDVTQVKALTFDVFGTVVNWRDSIIREGVKLSKAKGGLDVDWAEFADRWRGGYGPSMERVRTGELPWTNIDTLHRMILDELLDEFGISGLNGGREGGFQQGVAQAGPVAGLGAGADATEEGICDRDAV